MLITFSKDNKILIKQLLKHIEQFNALGYEHIVFASKVLIQNREKDY